MGLLRAHDFLEHLAPGREIIDFWNEAYRVLAPGGWLITHTPSTDGRGAWQDPTHLSGWNENSFLYISHKEQQQFVDGLHAMVPGDQRLNRLPHSVARGAEDLLCRCRSFSAQKANDSPENAQSDRGKWTPAVARRYRAGDPDVQLAQCPSGKIALPSFYSANKMLKQLKRRDQRKGRTCSSRYMGVYLCQRCHNWHVGHAMQKEGPKDG